MKIRKHFRTDTSIVDYIITDFNINLVNRQDCLDKCIAERIYKLNKQYDKRLDKIVSFIILRCDFDNLPIKTISEIALSLTRVMNILNKGFLFFLK